MREKLIHHLNKLRKYLGHQAFESDKNGMLTIGLGGFDYLAINSKNEVWHHTYQISFHNGDPYDHQFRQITDAECIKLLLPLKNQLQAEAAKKAKHIVEQRLIDKELRINGLVDDTNYS